MQATSQHYNLIEYALPDSLTALAGQSNLRLQGYLLTEQSLSQARTGVHRAEPSTMYNTITSRSCWPDTPRRSSRHSIAPRASRWDRRSAAGGWRS